MAMKLNMLPPSVNNMSVRVFVRAAGIPVEEENVWGQTQEADYLGKYPPGLTPTIEDSELPKGVLGESCAVMIWVISRFTILPGCGSLVWSQTATRRPAWISFAM